VWFVNAVDHHASVVLSGIAEREPGRAIYVVADAAGRPLLDGPLALPSWKRERVPVPGTAPDVWRLRAEVIGELALRGFDAEDDAEGNDTWQWLGREATIAVRGAPPGPAVLTFEALPIDHEATLTPSQGGRELAAIDVKLLRDGWPAFEVPVTV